MGRQTLAPGARNAARTLLKMHDFKHKAPGCQLEA
jgi:hypothetical protein